MADTSSGLSAPGALFYGEPQAYPAPSALGAETTTQAVQASSESATEAEISGGETYVPFGPPLQAAAVEADPGFSWNYFDGVARRTFRIAHSVGLMPLLRFAHSAKSGLDTDDLEGMAALYTMIRDTVHPDDWETFQAFAIESKAEDEELMEFVSAAMEVITARKAQPRGSSSATSQTISPKSRASSSPQGSVIPPGAALPPEASGLIPVSSMVR